MTKFFIPEWVVLSTLPAGHKVILAVLSTRSTESGKDRISNNMSASLIAHMTSTNPVSVGRSLKDLELKGIIKSIPGGYILPHDHALQDSISAATEPVYKPRYLFEGCYDWAACAKRIREEEGGLCLADIRFSYHEVAGSAPFRDEIYKILVRLEDNCKEKNLPDTHRFEFTK
jgi:hypothetical protein